VVICGSTERRPTLDAGGQAWGVGFADLALHASSQGLSLLPPRGAVEGDSCGVDTQPIEVQVYRQEVCGSGAIDAVELLVRTGLVETVLLDNY
jgi:hypothetical protein